MNQKTMNSYFGEFGGMFVPETLVPALKELEDAYSTIFIEPEFQKELDDVYKEMVGRPTPLYHAKKLSEKFGNSKIYLKREDLCHLGAHKINNTIGQVLLAKRMGKKRVIAETGAGQHGVATAAAAAAFGLECEVYMGANDIDRQSLNVYRMQLFGAHVVPVQTGSMTLKDAINEALRDYAANSSYTHYVIGSVVGPHPYPRLVRDLQSIIGREAREQILRKEGKLPTHLLACVGGGSNAIGLFHAFRKDPVQMIGVEAGGLGLETEKHGASICRGSPGVLHGQRSYFLQDSSGQIRETHSVSAGLDYPGVGPEHAHLHSIGRVEYVSVTDDEAVRAFRRLTRSEGIIPAMESSHAIAYLEQLVPTLPDDSIIIMCLSGRGDKDVGIVFENEEGVK